MKTKKKLPKRKQSKKLPKILVELKKKFDNTFGGTSGIEPFMPELDKKAS